MKSRIRQKRAAHSQTKAAQKVKTPASIADQARPGKMRMSERLRRTCPHLLLRPAPIARAPWMTDSASRPCRTAGRTRVRQCRKAGFSPGRARHAGR